MKRYKGYRLIISVVLCLCISFFVSSVVFASGNGDSIVHITKTGSKYHSAGCSYLKSDIEITLSNAVSQGYTPCSRCNPIILKTADYNEKSTTVTNLELKPLEEKSSSNKASINLAPINGNEKGMPNVTTQISTAPNGKIKESNNSVSMFYGIAIATVGGYVVGRFKKRDR